MNGTKKRAVLTKHGVDFKTVTELWNDEDRIEVQTAFPVENRSILIGKIGKKHWTAVFTRRNDAIRIISVKPVRDKETKLYEQK